MRPATTPILRRNIRFRCTFVYTATSTGVPIIIGTPFFPDAPCVPRDFLFIDTHMVRPGLNLEIEIKLQLQSFTNYLKLIGFLGAIDAEEQHINGFFDTEDRRLSAEGWALRVRVENQRGLVTLKSMSKPQGAAVTREELEAEISRPRAIDVLHLRSDILTLPVAPVEYVKKHYPDFRLARLIQFNNIRQFKDFKVGDYFHTFEIDKTEFADGSVDYELEIELKNEDQVDVVQNHLRRMFASLDIPFVAQDKSKYERALMKANLV
jgi:inorganic triphosphatase YgiF